MCSTPFGITGCYAWDPVYIAKRQLFVLNAFRHHRVLRPYIDRRIEIKVAQCSTPFGITGCYALDGAGRVGDVVECAQRLSASQGATPSSAVGSLSVLGAQRLSASQGATLWSTWRPARWCSRAQRLSASQGATQQPRRFRVRFAVCAQRLSASQGATHLNHDVILGDLNVLNAFRHHRVLRGNHHERAGNQLRAQRLSASQGATRQGRANGGRTEHVLNAFRHHRVLRPHRRSARSSSKVVLNAFRHHRVLRSRTVFASRARLVCSTPFGITGCYAVGS